MGNARCAMAIESGLEDYLNAIGFEKPGKAHKVAAATRRKVVVFIFQWL
jgi:hypothetical protein